MPIHRRAILKGGFAAIAAAGLPGFALRAETRRPEMRVIPSSGASIPVVGLGTWITFNVGRDPVLLDESVAVMAAFFEAGGTVIDSSPMYGSSQDTVGHGLAKLGYPPVFAADKVWTPAGGDGREQIGDSRRKWGVPRFDLMQVRNLVDWREHLETLFAMKAAGEIGHIGITTSHGRRHELLERIMREYPLDFVQLGARFAPNGELPSDDHANIRAIRRLSFEEGPHLLFISPPRADAAPGQVDR
jgi:predicted aldo/keto reductase-like oxidoreductase